MTRNGISCLGGNLGPSELVQPRDFVSLLTYYLFGVLLLMGELLDLLLELLRLGDNFWVRLCVSLIDRCHNSLKERRVFINQVPTIVDLFLGLLNRRFGPPNRIINFFVDFSLQGKELVTIFLVLGVCFALARIKLVLSSSPLLVGLTSLSIRRK